MSERSTLADGVAHEAESLVRMANQIASNAAFQPHEVAVAQVAAHLRDFWHPSMRAGLTAYVDGGGTGLDPLPREALDRLR
ncbi:MAG: formate dehydrogenase subunit delta [Actinomycetales bacterium]|nr:formate dehydrogenase subunit delta [Actinomycetales bacterium]